VSPTSRRALPNDGTSMTDDEKRDYNPLTMDDASDFCF